MTVADVWTLEGEHIPSHMVRNGHLLHVEESPNMLPLGVCFTKHHVVFSGQGGHPSSRHKKPFTWVPLLG